MAVHAVPMSVVTALWVVVGCLLPWFVPKGPNKSVIQVMLMLTAFCCWLFWFCAYLCQIYPLIGPAVHTSSLALMQREWGMAT